MIRSRSVAKSNIIWENSIDRMTFTLTELLFYSSLVLNLMYSIFYPVYYALHDYFHKILFAMAILIFVSSKKIKLNIFKAVGLFAFLALSLTAIEVNHSGAGLVIQFIWPLSIIYMFQNSTLSSRYIDRIAIIMFAGWLFSIIVSLNYTMAFFENFEAEMEKGSVNPNTIAIVIVITCLFFELYLEKKSKSKLAKTILYLMSFAALCRTRARTSLVAFAAILLIEIFFKKRLVRSKKLSMFIILAVITAGIVFPFIYASLYTNGIIAYDAVFLGKRVFTGRQSIWINLWNYLQSNRNAYIWGVGYNTELYSRGTFNIHNAYLMIFAQYGIPVLIIFLAYLIHSVYRFFGDHKQISVLQFKCYQIMVFVFIVGFAETILSYFPNLLYIAMAIGIGCREKKEDLAHDSKSNSLLLVWRESKE